MHCEFTHNRENVKLQHCYTVELTINVEDFNAPLQRFRQYSVHLYPPLQQTSEH